MEIDPTQHGCPNPECADHGKVGAGNIAIHCRADRRLRCTTCNKRFSARQGTIFYNIKTDEEKVLMALAMLAERNSARAKARILGTNEDTVLEWLAKAARHASEVSEMLIRRLKVSQAQLDEMWSFVEKKDEHRNQPDPAPDRGDVWIWRCIDAITKLRIANHISKTRDIIDAVPFLTKVADRLDSFELLPTTDKLRAYKAAILEVFGVNEPQNRIGRPANRRKAFPPGLLYGQVDKEHQHGRLVCVDRKAVVGTMAEIQAALDRGGSCRVINTSIVERDNLSVRQHNGRTVRKTLSHSKDWQDASA
jgi:IS1 family transposase